MACWGIGCTGKPSTADISKEVEEILTTDLVIETDSAGVLNEAAVATPPKEVVEEVKDILVEKVKNSVFLSKGCCQESIREAKSCCCDAILEHYQEILTKGEIDKAIKLREEDFFLNHCGRNFAEFNKKLEKIEETVLQ